MSILSETNVDLTHSDLEFIPSLSEAADRIAVAFMTLAEETDWATDYILECGNDDDYCDDPDCEECDPDDYEDDEFDLDDLKDLEDLDFSDDEDINLNDEDLDDLEGDYDEYF